MQCSMRRSLQYCGASLIRARASLPMTQQLREALSIQPPLPPLPLPFALLQVTVSFARSLLRFNLTLQCVSEPEDLLVWRCLRHIWDSMQKTGLVSEWRQPFTKPLNHIPLMTGQLRVFLKKCLSTLTKMSHCLASMKQRPSLNYLSDLANKSSTREQLTLQSTFKTMKCM